MKGRVINHKNRCEVEQYVKLKKRYDCFSWWVNQYVTQNISYSEFNRRYKKLVRRVYKRGFRSSIRAYYYTSSVHGRVFDYRNYRSK